MSDRPTSAPLIVACRLWEQTSSRTGKSYLVGTWGGLKVLVMENKNRSDDDTASHVLLVTERTPNVTQPRHAPRSSDMQDNHAVAPDHVAAARAQDRLPLRRVSRNGHARRPSGPESPPIIDDAIPF